MNSDKSFNILVESTTNVCPIGQVVGKKNQENGMTPVLSCEGACIRGEIARQTANILAKEMGFARGCHGELLSVPDSEIANWIKSAEKVVLIDGCFLHCHERMFRKLLGDRLVVFDALSHYREYTDLFDIDDVSEEERKKVAHEIADWVIETLVEERLPLDRSGGI